MSMRVCAGMLGLCFVLATGCDKSSSSPAGGTTTTSGAAPNRGGGGEDNYSKKLVGEWEAKEKIEGKEETISFEFKSDGSAKMSMAFIEMKGTYKVTKEEGKTVTISTEMELEGFGDAKAPPKKDVVLTATFEDADTMVLQKVGDKPDPRKFKRKK